jgi:acetyl-CoA C-acetyltransferase
MANPCRVGVIGVSIHPNITHVRRSLEEILFDTTHAMLGDAKLAIEAIDGIVVAANDQYDGRAIAVMAASGSVGGVDRDILSTPSAGEHAFVLGALRVATRQFRTQLVLAWSPTEAAPLREVQRLAADPYFHRALPLDENSAHALQATALLAIVPGVEDAAWAIVEKNRRNGVAAYPGAVKPVSGLPEAYPLRWPLREDMVTPPTTGAVGMVLASSDYISEHALKEVAWIEGMGWATEPSFLGDRKLAKVPALDAAVTQAYAAAKIDNPLSSFDVAEVSDTTPYQELLAYEALGLADREAWSARTKDGTFAAGGKLPVNLSGGALTFNPVFCSGMIRIAEVANQIRGRAGRHQLTGAKRGVAHAASGFAMQYNTVVVLGRGNLGGRP